MCFSAQASFGASAVLGIMGMYAARKAKPRESFLAVVPLLFGVQQFFEGVVWITYANPALHLTTMIATYGFCFFAFFFWPIWVPVTVLKMETNPRKIPFLYVLLGLGSLTASILAFTTIKNGITPIVSCSHIQYDIFLPGLLGTFGAAVYCMATILPLFISSKKWLPLFGVCTLGSVGITWYFYTTYFASVWCFFAAVLSSMIICML
jgi:hypothetical protein